MSQDQPRGASRAGASPAGSSGSSRPAPSDTPVFGTPTEGPVTPPPSEPKPATEIAQESGVGRAEAQRTDAAVVGKRTGMFGGSLGLDTSGYGGLQRPVVLPGAAQRPYGSYFDEIVDALEQSGASSGVEQVVVANDELTLMVVRDDLVATMQALRDEPALRFEMCVSVSGVHYPQQQGAQFHVVYHLLSITHGSRRVRVEVTCPDTDARVPSIVGVYPGADWHERETWDMFGVLFDGHPALTRILMPDDWPGHPQRKDYPLGGIPVEYKGATVPPPDQRRSYS